MTMVCAVHLQMVPGQAPDAETIVNGAAVCVGCMGYAYSCETFRDMCDLYRETMNKLCHCDKLAAPHSRFACNLTDPVCQFCSFQHAPTVRCNQQG